MTIELAVFDMAGTTVRDDGQVPRAFVSALARHDIHVPESEIVNVRGASKREAVRHFVPDGPQHDAVADAIYEAFCVHLTAAFAHEGVREVEGAGRTFAWLRSRGVKVAITTGFDRDVMTRLLTALGWSEGVADAFACLDDVAQGRPSPALIQCAMSRAGVTDPSRVAAIGDTTLDLEAGRRAGAGFVVGVLTGGHNRERLETFPHSAIIDSVADLPSVWPA